MRDSGHSSELQQAYTPEPSSRPLYRFALVPRIGERLPELAALAEPEDWTWKAAPSQHPLPV